MSYTEADVKRDDLHAIFNLLLDRSETLGVGLVDPHGFLVQSAGEHGGYACVTLAANTRTISNRMTPILTDVLSEPLREQIILCESYTLYLLTLEESDYLLYALAKPNVPGGRVRLALRESATALAPVLAGQALTRSPGQRLEQPRQFRRLSLTR
jgi:hypothetical protein